MRKHRAGAVKNGFTIMALDDDRTITDALKSYFETSGFVVDTEYDPIRAIQRMREKKYDILLLDYLMTPICGDEVVAQLRKFDTNCFVILLSGHKELAPPINTIRELDIQGYYEKSERFDQLELLVESCVKSIKHMRTIWDQNQQLNHAYAQLHDSYLQMISAVRLLVDMKDVYTRGHSDRVAYYAAELAKAITDDEVFIERVRTSGLLHDVGKVATDERILTKSSALTQNEYEEIRKHPLRGSYMLSRVAVFKDLAKIVRAHHERYDGSGYPDGLAGEKIPIEARILCIADSFDAMMSDRHYRPHMQLDEARQQLINGRGTQFDARLVDVFLKLLDRFDSMQSEIAYSYDLENPEFDRF